MIVLARGRTPELDGVSGKLRLGAGSRARHALTEATVADQGSTGIAVNAIANPAAQAAAFVEALPGGGRVVYGCRSPYMQEAERPA